MFVLCEEAKMIDLVGLCGLSPPYLPGSLHLYLTALVDRDVSTNTPPHAEVHTSNAIHLDLHDPLQSINDIN